MEQIRRELLPLPGEEAYALLDATGYILVFGTNQLLELGPKKGALLEILVRNPNQILSRSQVESRIWGPLSSSTVNYERLSALLYALRNDLDQVRAGMRKRIFTWPGRGFIWQDKSGT